MEVIFWFTFTIIVMPVQKELVLGRRVRCTYFPVNPLLTLELTFGVIQRHEKNLSFSYLPGFCLVLNSTRVLYSSFLNI